MPPPGGFHVLRTHMAVSQGLLDLLPAEHKLELEVVDWTQELEASGDRDVSLGPRSRAKPPTHAHQVPCFRTQGSYTSQMVLPHPTFLLTLGEMHGLCHFPLTVQV